MRGEPGSMLRFTLRRLLWTGFSPSSPEVARMETPAVPYSASARLALACALVPSCQSVLSSSWLLPTRLFRFACMHPFLLLLVLYGLILLPPIFLSCFLFFLFCVFLIHTVFTGVPIGYGRRLFPALCGLVPASPLVQNCRDDWFTEQRS